MLARLLLILIGIVLPCLALAVDLTLSLNATAQYDTNTSRSDSDETGDFSVRLGPTIQVRDERRKLSYQLRYTPTYQKYLQATELDKLSHNAGGTVAYQIGDKTSLQLTENFSLQQSVSSGSLSDSDDIGGSPATETNIGEIYRNRLAFLARHSFTPRLIGQVSVNHDFFDSENERTSRQSTLGSLVSLTYAIGARDRIGVGGGVSWQQFEGVQDQPGSDTYTYRFFGSWLHTFEQNTELSIRGGPALISTKQERPHDEGRDAQFFHRNVDVGGTVAEVYSRLGLATPPFVSNINGDPYPFATIAAGSVLVVNPNLLNGNLNGCLTGGMVGTTRLIDPDRCAFSRVIQPTDGSKLGGMMRPFTTAIRDDKVNFAFAPGENPGATSDSSITFFGEVSLSHKWNAKLSSTLTFSRSDSSASSLGSSTVADQATMLTTWDPTKKWRVTLRADWLQRKSVNEITNTFRDIAETDNSLGILLTGYNGDLLTTVTDRSVDTTYYSASGRASYWLTRHITVTGRISYQKQDISSASTSSNSDFGDVIAFLGVRYDLDPFHF